ncbi:MAG TPA: GNAT family N-acetyltransferase [Pseudonocardia sp.]
MDAPGDLVGAELIGRRVALRHRVDAGRVTDAVGELADGGADAVVVHTRRGPVRVARSAVVAIRAIPPPVPRRASWTAVAELEHRCADAWPARVDRPLGAWRLRAAGGFTGRANAALALGDPGVPVPAALDAVRAFAAAHGIAPRVHAPLGSPWDRAVAAAGWVLDAGHAAGAEVAVLVADVDRLVAAGGDHPAAVLLTERPGDAWWAQALGRDPAPAERGVLDPGPPLPTAFGLVPDAGAVRAAVVGEHLHLSRLSVRPDARRAGLGTRLTAAAAAWGRDRGARWAVLQVALHNTAARALYRRLGAVEHHRYRYLVPPADS